MKTYNECIPCFIRQALGAVRSVTHNQETVGRTLRRVCRLCADMDMEKTPPQMGQEIHRIVREVSDNPDPYRDIKKRSNQAAFYLLKEAEEIMEESKNRFETGVRFSIAGNIMDFALTDKWDHKKTRESFENVAHRDLDLSEIKRLEKGVEEAESILILGDNCGEIVFDKLLIDQIPGDKRIFYGVKGSPVINDALEQDAVEAGIDKRAVIVSNGTDAPGNILDICSQEFLKIFSSADMVLAKGQANYETLSTCERDIYFLTQVKCPVIARDLERDQGDWVVKYIDNS